MTKLFTAEDFASWRHYPDAADVTGTMATIANARLAPLVEALDWVDLHYKAEPEGTLIGDLLAAYRALRKERP